MNTRNLLVGILLMLFVSSVGFTDDIKLMNGKYLFNIKIIDSTASEITYKDYYGTHHLNRNDVEEIFAYPYDASIKTEYLFGDQYFEKRGYPKNEPGELRFERPRLYLLSISALSLAIAWDNFSDVSDYDDWIDIYEKLDKDTDKLKNDRTRKIIVGSVAVVAFVVNTYFALEKVQVTANNKGVGLSYSF